MMIGRDGILIVLALLVVGAFRVCRADGLVENFYNTSCPQAEAIVRNISRSRAESSPPMVAKLLRMHFHDCFVRGCDGSILLDGVGNVKAEKDTIPNLSLSGYDLIDEIKTEVEKVCPGVVSCADILALAARDAVTYPNDKARWEVLTGRRDGNVSLGTESDESLPNPSSNFTSLIQLFKTKGLDVTDLVVLSGGHTIGVANCATFINRLYNFTGKGDADPSLNTTYADFLKTLCPVVPSPATTVEMDPESSLVFDNNYFKAVLENKGLLESDAALLQNEESTEIVRQLTMTNSTFDEKFAISMQKMGAIGVLTGDAGQIRKNCRVANP
ncbi:hypothetical protein JCGZ_02040 [Jatropha curcas]|uniref:Peroxidase n=2 Tax=Jatropha curcas TaxID=180498 RepID=A0A067KV59_JATCU|nr:hypothetical protein JCGZ_02040 [Jatropha curcas]